MCFAHCGEPNEWLTRREIFTVSRNRTWHYNNTAASEMHAPTQVHLFATKGDARMETTQGTKQVGPHEQASTGQTKHVGYCVVLLLVFFSWKHNGVNFPATVDAHSHMLQERWVVPLHKLWAHHGRIGTRQFGDEFTHRITGKTHIVVQKEKETVVAIDQTGCGILGWPITRVTFHFAHGSEWQMLGNVAFVGLSHLVVGPHQEKEVLERLVVLAHQASHNFGEVGTDQPF
jgi:hypothetical protein